MIFSARKKNQGAVLATALVILMPLTLIAVTVAYRTIMDESMSANQRDHLNALGISESGIEAGYAEVKSSYNDLSQNLCDDNAGVLIDSTNLSGGSYIVTAHSCVDGERAVLNSLGTSRGAVREVEILLEMEPGGGGNWPSFLANDYINISDPKFVGPLIHIHSNGVVKASGADRCALTGPIVKLV